MKFLAKRRAFCVVHGPFDDLRGMTGVESRLLLVVIVPILGLCLLDGSDDGRSDDHDDECKAYEKVNQTYVLLREGCGVKRARYLGDSTRQWAK